MATTISNQDLSDAYALGRKSNDELTQEMLKEKGWETSKILAVFNRMVEARICSLQKFRNGNPSIWCKMRLEKNIGMLKQLDNNDYKVYCIIEEAGNRGIWTADIRKQSNFQSHQIQKSVKQLCEIMQLIKPVKNIHVKNRKVYMLNELEPAKEIAGGSFYTNSEFNFQLVEHLRERISHFLMNGQATNLEAISNFVRSSGGLRMDISDSDIRMAIKSLELDEKVVASESHSSEGTLFMWNRWTHIFSVSEIPCGTCPVFNLCGLGKSKISPKTCEYIPKWLGYSSELNEL